MKLNLKKLVQKKTNISNRIKSFEELNINDIAVYYSDWTYQAIHVATAIKNYQTIPRIAQKFNLSESKVNKVLEFLTKSGLVEVKNHFYKNSKPFVHLNSDSDFIIQHHRDWRIKLMEALKNVNENMHYSFVISCSEVDATKIKEIMIESIKLLRLYATHSF